MLNKISNIESAKGYRSSNHKLTSSAYEKFLRSYTSKEEIAYDTVQFSPAAVFLSSVHWDAVELDYKSANELALSFKIDEINFYLELNFVDFYKISHQQIFISRQFKKYGNSKKQEVLLSVKKPEVKIFDKYPAFGISGIKRLFNKISSLNIEGVLTKNDSFALSGILENIEQYIYDDFVNIFYVIYSFIAKLGKYGLTKETVFPSTKTNRIVIEKIAVKNV